MSAPVMTGPIQVTRGGAFLCYIPSAQHMNVKVTQAPDGLYWACDGQSGFFQKKDKALTQNINPSKHLCVVYGFGDGQLLDELCAHDSLKEILVFEPSPTFFEQVKKTPVAQRVLKDPRVYVHVDAYPENYLRCLENYYFQGHPQRVHSAGNFFNLAQAGMEKIPGYQERCLAFADAFSKALNNIMALDIPFTSEDAFVGLKNSLKNRLDPAFAALPLLDDYAGTYRGKPGLLLASGPSLVHSLPYVKKIKDKVVLVACDSTLHGLLKEGIEPDFVVTIERLADTSRLFQNLPSNLKTVLVGPSMVPQVTWQAYPGPKATLRRQRVGFDDWLFPNEPNHWLGMTVGQIGLVTLAILGCQPIFFAGMDCAYAQQNQESHFSGMHDYLKTHAEWEKKNPVFVNPVKAPGYQGQIMDTMSIWYMNTILLGDIIVDRQLKVTNIMPLQYGIPIPETNREDPGVLSSLEKNEDLPKFNLKQHQHIFSEKALSDGVDYFQFVSRKCLDTMDALTDVWPSISCELDDNVVKYLDVFAKCEAVKAEIIHHPSSLFQYTFGVLISSFLFKNGYLIEKCVADYPDAKLRVFEQAKYHLEWFKRVSSWADRLSHLVTSQIARNGTKHVDHIHTRSVGNL